MRRPATTTAKQRVRSVRRKKNTTSRPTVVPDSFVEDSQDSLSEYSVRKLPQQSVPIGSASASAQCNNKTGTVVEDREDEYNLLESTEELELPCRAESADELREVDAADVTVVSEMSHVVGNAHDASTAADTVAAADAAAAMCVHSQPAAVAHPSMQTPQPPLPPDSDAVSNEHAATSGRQQRLSSLPTLQLDGQLDTPASTVRDPSSVVEKVLLFAQLITVQC